MTAARSARHIVTGVAAISATAAAISLVAASSAAATPGRRALAGSAAMRARLHAAPVRSAAHSGTKLPTLLARVQVFASPSMASKVFGKMRTSGTSVTVSCWTTGVGYAGDPIWYSITAPQSGYVPAYAMAAHTAPFPGVPHCASPVFGRDYHSLAANLKVRSVPTFNGTVIATLGPIGTATNVKCFVTGSAVMGDNTWYYESSPAPGYISGRFLNTGGDPAWGVPHC
jgi:hypothetical protein